MFSFASLANEILVAEIYCLLDNYVKLIYRNLVNCQLQEQANNLDCSPHFSFFFFFFFFSTVCFFFFCNWFMVFTGSIIIYTITLASPKPEGAKEVKDWELNVLCCRSSVISFKLVPVFILRTNPQSWMTAQSSVEAASMKCHWSFSA